jgi:hypothetical protein
MTSLFKRDFYGMPSANFGNRIGGMGMTSLFKSFFNGMLLAKHLHSNVAAAAEVSLTQPKKRKK